MKRLLSILIVGVLLISSTYGQSLTEDERIAKRMALKLELQQTRHQVEAGIGLTSWDVPLYNVFGSEIISHTIALSVSYSYRVVDFLEVGARFTNSSYDSRVSHYYAFDLTHSYDLKTDIYTLGVFARYAWLNFKWVSLYSSLGLDVNSIDYTPYNVSEPHKYDKVDNVTSTLSVCPIGVRFGGRLFGYVEPLNLNTHRAFFNFGVGFKF